MSDLNVGGVSSSGWGRSKFLRTAPDTKRNSSVFNPHLTFFFFLINTEVCKLIKPVFT